MKDKRKVMLGCWGLGGTLAGALGKRRRLEYGPFAGHSIPSAAVEGMENLTYGWRLPPLARQTRDGIDLMPFVLYDQVTMDQMSFECLIGARPSLMTWKPSRENVQILEKLASNGRIVFENYPNRLNSPEVAQLIDDMNTLDLSDENILAPTLESLQLWIKFYKDLFGAKDSNLLKFHHMISALQSEKSRDYSLGYIYECISDINRILVLSQELALPIYEWEDYCKYYRYKFLRTAKVMQKRPRGQTLAELFEVFMPNFAIRSYEELEDICGDGRLSAVQQLVDDIGDKPIDKDLVIQANTDMLRIKKRVETFSKYIGLIGYPLSLLPGPIGNIIQDVASNVAKYWLERNIKWQMFFIERAHQYEERQVLDKLNNT